MKTLRMLLLAVLLATLTLFRFAGISSAEEHTGEAAQALEAPVDQDEESIAPMESEDKDEYGLMDEEEMDESADEDADENADEAGKE